MSPSTLAVPDKGREKEAGGKGPHCCKGQEGAQTSATQTQRCTPPAVQEERHGPCFGQGI